MNYIEITPATTAPTTPSSIPNYRANPTWTSLPTHTITYHNSLPVYFTRHSIRLILHIASNSLISTLCKLHTARIWYCSLWLVSRILDTYSTYGQNLPQTANSIAIVYSFLISYRHGTLQWQTWQWRTGPSRKVGIRNSWV